MKHISIIVPVGDAILSSIVGPYKIFNKVNEIALSYGVASSPLFKVELVGISTETSLQEGLFFVKPRKHIRDVERTDLVIIPALNGDLQAEVLRNAEFIPWIVKQHAQGAEVASICVGAFLLAATGLLKGRSCATHWASMDLFRMVYPDVNTTQAIVYEDERIYTNGGAYSFLNLMMHLVEKYVNRDVAVYCAKYLEIDIDRHSQAQFSVFSGFKQHGDQVILQAQQLMEHSFIERQDMEKIASRCAMSRRSFERRFKKATHYTPSEYIQLLRIEAARRRLETSDSQVNEVMYTVGYNDSKTFRTLFKKVTGLTPVEYRNKYRNQKPVVV